MRVLLSAYACEPDKGSEPEIGWQRALHMTVLADEVWVLTRSNNKTVIEANPLSRDAKLHFIYYDLPSWALKLKKQKWFMPVYFILWQWGAGRLAAKHHKEKKFDCVYHVTFTGMLAGSFMGRLGIPFIVGPIAGGERAPLRLRRGMQLHCKVKELLRDLGILFQRYSPLSCAAFAAAERIYVSTPESLRLIQAKWHSKTQVQLSIAICGRTGPRSKRRPPALPRFVYAGRLLHWKGVHFAIRALAEARKTLPAATLALFGSGLDEQWLRSIVKEFGVADAVEFAGHLPRQQLMDALGSYTAFVFPSLHDSGGSVVMEALQAGAPVICLDLGGPGMMVNASCGIVVPCAGADEAWVVTSIASAMISLGTMPATESAQLSAGAITRANELSWVRLTERIGTCQGPKLG
jgi:glycosyltransferase involved in cell wall biosynthesis